MTCGPVTRIPAVDPDPREPPARGRPAPGLILAWAAVLILSAVNLYAAQRLYAAGTELARLDSRIERLSAFEKRLIERIDLVNEGIQTKIEGLGERLDGDIEEAVRFAGRASGTARSVADPTDEPLTPPIDPDVAYAPVEGDAAEGGDAAEAAAEVTIPLPAGSTASAYRRIEAEDGKVYYRRVR